MQVEERLINNNFNRYSNQTKHQSSLSMIRNAMNDCNGEDVSVQISSINTFHNAVQVRLYYHGSYSHGVRGHILIYSINRTNYKYDHIGSIVVTEPGEHTVKVDYSKISDRAGDMTMTVAYYHSWYGDPRIFRSKLIT